METTVTRCVCKCVPSPACLHDGAERHTSRDLVRSVVEAGKAASQPAQRTVTYVCAVIIISHWHYCMSGG